MGIRKSLTSTSKHDFDDTVVEIACFLKKKKKTLKCSISWFGHMYVSYVHIWKFAEQYT